MFRPARRSRPNSVRRHPIRRKRVLAIEGDRADRPLDGIGIDLDPAVVEEAVETLPVREPVADRLGELALPAQERELFAEPRLELGDEWARAFLSDGAARVRLAAEDVGLDPIERGDALQRLGCDRRRLGDEALVEAAPQVGPAEGRGSPRPYRRAREKPA